MPKWRTWLDWILAPHGKCEEDAAMPYPEMMVEALCGHCECIRRGHPCCRCGAWLKDIRPVEATEKSVTCNAIAMEYGKRYRFVFKGLRWYAVRHANGSMEMVRVIGREEAD